MNELLNSQLFSVFVGFVLTITSSMIIGRKTYVDSLNEKIVDERIAAYKKIYNTIAKLNNSLSPMNAKKFPDECYIPYKYDGENEYRLSFCFPEVFLSFKNFHDFKAELAFVLNENRIYLEQPVLNTLFVLDLYLSEIWNIANGKNDDFLHMLGFLLGNDIDTLRGTIEKDIHEFFLTGKSKMKNSNFADPYKFAEKYIRKTDLYTLRENLKSGNYYGNFPLCANCLHRGKCPINRN